MDAIVSEALDSAGAFPTPDRTGACHCISKRGFHDIAYVEWGDPASDRVAVCVHGLSRQGRDFDRLAAAMAQRGWRVVCPDLAGRGRSDWLRDPQEYNLPQYAADMATLIARLDVPAVDWIGTSLGGLIGMVVAGQDNSPVRRLVVNDVAPFLPWKALLRLGDGVRNAPRSFPDLAAAVKHYRTMLKPFGNLSDAEWHHLAVHSVIQDPAGRYHKLFDPDITASFHGGLYFNLNLWNYWDAMRCPVLVVRGAESDLLLASTAREMARRGPGATIAEVSGCGHAPALLDQEQIGAVVDWLEANNG